MAPPNLTVLLLVLVLVLVPHSTTAIATTPLQFREAPAFRNGKDCPTPSAGTNNFGNSSTMIHIAMTLDYSSPYLRGSVAAILSVLQHATCPENTFFHFITTTHSNTFTSLHAIILSTFPYLHFSLYHFNPATVTHLISTSIRRALDQPLNYARIYLSNLLPPHIHRIIYLDSDLIVVDDIFNLWKINLNGHVIGAPEYCHANFTMYFTPNFWTTHFSKMFKNSTSRPCYFNTGLHIFVL